MFIRKKKRSGTTSVIVVDKSQGKFKELKSMDTGSIEAEIVTSCLKTKGVAAWEKERNSKDAKIDWQFKTEDSRIKLKNINS